MTSMNVTSPARLVNPSSEEFQALVGVLAGDSCRELFRDYGGELAPAAPDVVPGEGLCFCAVVGFYGEALRASLVLGMSPSAIAELTCLSGSRERDVVGELSNQLLGRLKNKFLERDVEFDITVPVVLRGEHFAPAPKTPLRPTVFQLGAGSVWLWVELECSEGFSMLSEPDESKAGMPVGEMLLF